MLSFRKISNVILLFKVTANGQRDTVQSLKNKKRRILYYIESIILL